MRGNMNVTATFTVPDLQVLQGELLFIVCMYVCISIYIYLFIYSIYLFISYAYFIIINIKWQAD
jgi:hypothetical protein